MKRYRRKKFLINKKLQYGLLAYNAAYFFVIMLSLAGTLFFPLYFQLSDPNLNYRELGEIADKILFLHSRIWIVLLVVLIFIALHSIIISHRIAGPLYRFRAIFRQIRDGDLSKPIRIRKGDFLMDEQAVIEEMMDMLRSRIGQIKGEHAAMGKAVREIVGEHGSELPRDLRRKIEALEKHCARLKQEIDYFTLISQTGSDR